MDHLLKPLHINEAIHWMQDRLSKVPLSKSNDDQRLMLQRMLQMMAALREIQNHYHPGTVDKVSPVKLVKDEIALWRICKAPNPSKEFFENAARLADEAAKIFEERKKKGDL